MMGDASTGEIHLGGIQLTSTGVTGGVDEAQLAAEFSTRHYVRFPRLIAPALLGRVQARLRDGEWVPKSHGGIKEEIVLPDPLALHLLAMLTNREPFLRLIERITGCPPLQLYYGRVYRMLPGGEHFDSWHDDLFEEEGRVVGMSINLGEEPYTGGVFRMRDRATKTVIAEVPNTGPGDATVFRIGPALQHMVTAVEGDFPKTEFAGWFRSKGEGYANSMRAVMRQGN